MATRQSVGAGAPGSLYAVSGRPAVFDKAGVPVGVFSGIDCDYRYGRAVIPPSRPRLPLVLSAAGCGQWPGGAIRCAVAAQVPANELHLLTSIDREDLR